MENWLSSEIKKIECSEPIKEEVKSEREEAEKIKEVYRRLSDSLSEGLLSE